MNPAREWRPLALLTALPLIVFADVVLFGAGFFFRDLFVNHYPTKWIVYQTILSGEFPFWHRYFAGGQPVAANPVWEVFYPPQWLIFAGGYHFGFNLHILFHVYLALFGMYAFLRELPLTRAAALFGALSFGLGSFFLGTMTNLPTFFVWAWAPLVMCLTLRFGRERTARRFAVAASALGIQLLVMEPTALLQVWLVIGTGAVVARGRVRNVALVALLAVAAVGVAAVQVIPALDHARDSGRARGFAYEGMVAHSMPASRPLEMIVPRLYGVIDPDVRHFWGGAAFGGAPYLLSVYAGFAVAALAVAGLIARVRGTGIVAAIAVVSYILAIGDSTPLYRLLHAIGMRSIRYPEKFIASAVFVLIVFAAVVADRLLGGDDRLLRKTRIVSIVFVIIAAAAALIAFSPSLFASVWQSADASAARAPLSLGAGLAVAWLIAFLAFGRVDRQRWSAAVFVLLLVDVVWLGRSFAPARGRAFFTAPPIAKQLRGEPGIFNVVNRGDWAVADPNRGKTTALSRSFAARNAMAKMTPALWNIRTVMQADFDATFLLATHEFMDAMTRAARSGRGDWAEAFMAVSNVRYVLDYRDFETAMRESRGDLMHARPVVATRRPNRGQYYFSNDEGRVLSMRETANTATVEVDAHTPALLFATVTRHKYWRATVDGEPVRPVGANIAYQAIPVPQGRHRVEMRYFNPLVVVSGLVSLATIVALAIMTLRRRRPRPQSES